MNPNKAILEEVGDQWFLARKTKGLRARKLEEDMEVETLEGPVPAKAGSWLCQGAAGELWPQGEKKILASYDQKGEPDEDGWTDFEPKADMEPVEAFQVNHEFKVTASWGELTGKDGDYIVRRASAPEDVWIVDQDVFEDTYSTTA